MLILSLILKVNFHTFRKVLKIPVIPDKTNLINQDQRVWRKFIATKIFGTEESDAWYFPITINMPPFFLVLKSELRHQSRLAGSLFSKTHIELIRVPVTISLNRYKHKTTKDKNQKDISHHYLPIPIRRLTKATKPDTANTAYTTQYTGFSKLIDSEIG